MEYLKEQIKNRKDVPSFKDYCSEDELLKNYVDDILLNHWIDDEKCSWDKVKIWNINNNNIFIYKVSDKYINESEAYIYLYIWWFRKNSYKLHFTYKISDMITWDFSDDDKLKRVEHVILDKNIFIQDKKTKKWKLLWNINKEFNYELDKIKKLIILEYLNPKIL